MRHVTGRARAAKQPLSLILTLAFGLTLGACSTLGGASPAPSGPLRVITTINVFGDMIKQVGGERVAVTSLVPAGPTSTRTSRSRPTSWLSRERA